MLRLRIQPIFDRYAAHISTHPWRWAVVVAVATAAALAGLARLEFDDDPRAIYMGDDLASVQLQTLYEQFGADDQDILIVVKAADVFEPEVMNAVRDLGLAAAQVEGVERLYSIYSLRLRGSRVIPLVPRREASSRQYAEAKQLALNHPLAVGHFVSPDATTMLLIARLAGEPENVAKLKPPVAELRRLAEETAATAPVEVWLTGHPVLRVDILSALMKDHVTFVLASGLVSTLVGFIVFRRFAAVLIVVLTPLFGVLWVVSMMPMAGLRLNGINAVLPTLIYAIGVTDAVHLVIGLRRRHTAGDSRSEAARSVVQKLALPCFLTSVTTAIGFGSLALAHELSIRQFGLICASGTLLNFVAVMTVLPLMALSPLGDNLLRKQPLAHDGWKLNLLPLVRFVETYPKSIVFSSLVGGVAMIAICTRLGPDFVITESLPTSIDSVVAMQQLDRTVGGGMMGYVVMDWPEEKRLGSPEVLETLDKVHTAISARPEFRGPFSVRNLLLASSENDRPLWQSVGSLRQVPSVELSRLVRLEDRRLIVSFHISSIGAARLAPAFDQLGRELAELGVLEPGFRFHVTGSLPVAARNLWIMIGDLGRSLAMSAVLVFVVIGISLRSWKLGLLSLLPNVLPLLVTSTLLVLCGEPLRIVSVLTYSLCLGIAVDDAIHFLVRFQRSEREQTLREAIEHTFQTAGTGIVTSTVILVGGFSVMLLSQMPSIRWFALLCDVAMVTALGAVLVILPALLMCFWPERVLAREGETPAEPPGRKSRTVQGRVDRGSLTRG